MAMSGPQSSQQNDDNDESGIFVDINVTPLVDIMLVLLIIFMVSTTVMTEDSNSSGIHVDLPKAKAKGDASQQSDLIIALTQEGQIVHSGEAISIDQLKTIFENTHKKNAKANIIIQADKEVKHGKVTEVLDLARSIGLEQLSIGTESSD